MATRISASDLSVDNAVSDLPIDQVIEGDSLEVLASLPAESVDMIFADPPYNLQLAQELWRPNLTRVDAVDDDWDRFESFAAYDEFTRQWMSLCRRVLKRKGTLWVIGTYHNIYRVGAVLQDLGYWILNDLVWTKVNPMPNFRGVRFTNAHETLLWAQKERGASYTFNYRTMKALNDGLQMRSDWSIPICSGKERLRVNGEKAHPTQKPEALLYRVLLASTNSGDVVLDPFFGTGTTGAVARRLHRHFIGIERNPFYVEIARQRISEVRQVEFDPPVFFTPDPRRQPRLPFGLLLENGLLEPGQPLFFGPTGGTTARILADGTLEYGGQRGSIHQIARLVRNAPCNGWEAWFYWDEQAGERRSIDSLRQRLRQAAEGETDTDEDHKV
ncbi:MAG: site-specific DNA-methyltransferase [Chloroflexi bacterium]|nr:site-specific DNA-methyltransferase [Chloroflexota bacterium]